VVEPIEKKYAAGLWTFEISIRRVALAPLLVAGVALWIERDLCPGAVALLRPLLRHPGSRPIQVGCGGPD